MQLTEKQQRAIEYLRENKAATVHDIAAAIRGTKWDAWNVIAQLKRKHLVKARYSKQKRTTFGGTKVARTKTATYSLIN